MPDRKSPQGANGADRHKAVCRSVGNQSHPPHMILGHGRAAVDLGEQPDLERAFRDVGRAPADVTVYEMTNEYVRSAGRPYAYLGGFVDLEPAKARNVFTGVRMWTFHFRDGGVLHARSFHVPQAS